LRQIYLCQLSATVNVKPVILYRCPGPDMRPDTRIVVGRTLIHDAFFACKMLMAEHFRSVSDPISTLSAEALSALKAKRKALSLEPLSQTCC